MDIAVDSNLLIYATIEEMPQHAAAAQALGRLARTTGDRIVVTVYLLQEVLHLVTDARRFEGARSMAEATHLVRSYLGRDNVRVLASDELDMESALDLMGHHRLGRNRVGDTLLAATLRRHGVSRLWTANARDFKLFQFLTVENPLEG